MAAGWVGDLRSGRSSGSIQSVAGCGSGGDEWWQRRHAEWLAAAAAQAGGLQFQAKAVAGAFEAARSGHSGSGGGG